MASSVIEQAFSLSQFRTERRDKVTVLTARMRSDLGCIDVPMDFTITSHVTGTTVWFEYFGDDPIDWAKLYTVARSNNGHVPNVLDLRKTLRVRLYS